MTEEFNNAYNKLNDLIKSSWSKTQKGNSIPFNGGLITIYKNKSRYKIVQYFSDGTEKYWDGTFWTEDKAKEVVEDWIILKKLSQWANNNMDRKIIEVL